MGKLKLGSLEDDKLVKLSVELPAHIYRNLVAYADILGQESGIAPAPARIIAPTLERFMSADREFARRRRPGAARTPDSSIAPERE